MSPLKNSTLVSVYSAEIENDFGSMSRGEGNPVPFEHQFYSTVFKGAFSLDLYHAGRFSTINKSGYKNLSQDWIEKNKGKINELGAVEKNGYWILPPEERKRRIKDTISVLPYFYGMAKQSGHLTDITPKFIILAVMDGGNNPFMGITFEDYGTYQSVLDRSKFINVKALREVISDYTNEIISDIFIGRREGFQDNISDELKALKNEFKGKIEIHLLSPKKAVEEFLKIVENHVE
ncbi:MAG: type I-B CRISPR-associated protein Cas7/Cst2/DevR [Cyclobacteriaceae bacterium]